MEGRRMWQKSEAPKDDHLVEIESTLNTLIERNDALVPDEITRTEVQEEDLKNTLYRLREEKD